MPVFSEGYGRNIKRRWSREFLDFAHALRRFTAARGMIALLWEHSIVTRLGQLPKAMSAFKNFGRDSFLGESPSGKAPDFDSGIRRFDPYLPSHTRDR